MRIAPTLDRRLRIDVENATDWLVLEMICTDACQKQGDSLAAQLALYMAQDEDWDDLVTPDLHALFNEQVAHVSRAISVADKDANLIGSLFIEEEEASIWFGAINQARLSLEERFSVSEYDIDEEHIVSNVEEGSELHAAIIRYHFYTHLQSIILEYIFE